MTIDLISESKKMQRKRLNRRMDNFLALQKISRACCPPDMTPVAVPEVIR